MAVPTIDLASFRVALQALPEERRQSTTIQDFSEEAQKIARDWRKAFAEYGFCNAVGHGVPDDVIEDAYSVARRFFSLPLDEKMRCDTGKEYGASSGFKGVGGERVSATATSLPGAEVLGTEKARPPDSVESMIFFGREDDVIPDVEGYRETMLRYRQELRQLLLTVMALTAASLELPVGYFDEFFTEEKQCQNEMSMRLAYYPACETSPGQLRYGEHTDYTGFTLLWQDHNVAGPQTAKDGIKPPKGGLQVQMPDGSWADCPPPPGAFTINAGDLIQAWTNDEFLSNMHRVTNPPPEETHDRISLVVFTGPGNDTIVEPLPTCVSSTKPAKYGPISAGEHLTRKLQASTR